MALAPLFLFLAAVSMFWLAEEQSEPMLTSVCIFAAGGFGLWGIIAALVLVANGLSRARAWLDDRRG